MSIFNKIFKSYSEKEVKRIMPIVDKINSLEDEISKLTDEELKNKTNEFKEQLDNGKTLDMNKMFIFTGWMRGNSLIMTFLLI